MINSFCRIVRSDTTVQALSPFIEHFKQSSILSYLIRDPTAPEAIQCIKTYAHHNQAIPNDFASKLLSILTAKISITPHSFGVLTQSLTAKVSLSNLYRPTAALTNITCETRINELRKESERAVIISRTKRKVPQALRLQLKEDLLPQCINAMSDLNKTIMDGNRAAGLDYNSYIDTVSRP